ncbi:uncharacterized protein METZ01_LOCUS434508, partial [marine metagenome]
VSVFHSSLVRFFAVRRKSGTAEGILRMIFSTSSPISSAAA